MVRVKKVTVRSLREQNEDNDAGWLQSVYTIPVQYLQYVQYLLIIPSVGGVNGNLLYVHLGKRALCI